MSSSVYNFIRVDTRKDPYDECRSYLTYVWECADCGGEYSTATLHRTSLCCPSCRKAQKERAKIAAKNKLKKEQSAALKAGWKDIMNCGGEEVTIGGEKYISKTALEKRFKDLLA